MKQSFEKMRMYFYCRLKIVLAQLIVNYVEALQDVKSGPSYVRIRLTYTETKPSIIPSKSVDRNGGSKRRKTGMQVCLHVNEMLFSCKWPFLPWSTAAVNPLIFSILVFIMMIPCLPETQCFWLRILYILNAEQL